MCYSPYHRGYNPLTKNYKTLGVYDVAHMCEESWCYVVDNFGNAVAYQGHWFFSPFLGQTYN